MDKISPIKKRILEYIDYKGITKTEFCNIVDISYNNLRGKSLESEFGGAHLTQIINKCGEISPLWLLTGKGTMLQNQSNKETQLYEELLAAKDREIESKQQTINSLNEYINVLKNMSKLGDSFPSVG